MTARQLFEYALIELNKVQAPSLILEDYNYFINKAVSQVINKIYNLFEINQQKTDDLRVLRSSAVLIPSVNNYSQNSLYTNTYEVNLPDDYLHILNCVIEFTFSQQSGCNLTDRIINVGAKKLTSDSFPQLLNNYYFKPSYKNPYFYINNVTIDSTYPTTDSQFPLSQDLSLTAKEWTSNKIYPVNSLIKIFDGSTSVTYYICTIAHTSGNTPNLDNFNLIGGSDRDSQLDP